MAPSPGRPHDPERAEEMAEARRLGGIRRRRERTLAGAYGLAGVRTVEDLLRVVEIAVFNLLGAENSISQARALLHAALVGAKLLETGDLEERLEALEAAQRKDEEAGVPRSPEGGLLDEDDL